MQKRGMSNQTIIMIVVGVLVLLGIILGVVFLGGEKEEGSEPDPVAEQCAFQCESGSVPGFCSMKMEFDDLSLTCETLATNSQYANYGVQECGSISCIQESSPSSQTCISLGGEWETPAADGDCVQDSDKIKREMTTSDDAPEAGQICCR